MIKQNILLTTDCVIFERSTLQTMLLLIQRKNPPFQNMWALPGGFVEDSEPLMVGAKRELREETGLEIDELFQIGAFGAPDRDPRGRTVTIAYWGSISERSEVRGNDDAARAQWFPLDQLPELAFDHALIIKAALSLSGYPQNSISNNNSGI